MCVGTIYYSGVCSKGFDRYLYLCGHYILFRSLVVKVLIGTYIHRVLVTDGHLHSRFYRFYGIPLILM